jgi:hypothetical protein
LLDLTGLGKLPDQSDRGADARFLAGSQVSAKVRREADRLVLALFADDNLSAPAFER